VSSRLPTLTLPPSLRPFVPPPVPPLRRPSIRAGSLLRFQAGEIVTLSETTPPFFVLTDVEFLLNSADRVLQCVAADPLRSRVRRKCGACRNTATLHVHAPWLLERRARCNGALLALRMSPASWLSFAWPLPSDGGCAATQG
jgi:hypothetical protein